MKFKHKTINKGGGILVWNEITWHLAVWEGKGTKASQFTCGLIWLIQIHQPITWQIPHIWFVHQWGLIQSHRIHLRIWSFFTHAMQCNIPKMCKINYFLYFFPKKEKKTHFSFLFLFYFTFLLNKLKRGRKKIITLDKLLEERE